MLDYKSYTVLYVDDDAVQIELMKSLLGKHLDIIGETDPYKASKFLIDNDNIAVVISDHHMPKMMGETFLCEVKLIRPDIVTVLTSAHYPFESAVKTLNKSNLYRYVDKGASPEDKEKSIKQAIEKYHEDKERKRIKAKMDEYTNTDVLEVRPLVDKMAKPVTVIEEYDERRFLATQRYFLALEHIVFHELQNPEKHHTIPHDYEGNSELENLDQHCVVYRSIGDRKKISASLRPYFSDEEIVKLFKNRTLNRDLLYQAFSDKGFSEEDKTMVSVSEDALSEKISLHHILIYSGRHVAEIQQQPEAIVYNTYEKEPNDKIIVNHGGNLRGHVLHCRTVRDGHYEAWEEDNESRSTPDEFFCQILGMIHDP